MARTRTRSAAAVAAEIRQLWRIMRNGGKDIGRKALEVVPFDDPAAETKLADLADQAEMPAKVLARNWHVMAFFEEDADHTIPDTVAFSVLEEILRGYEDGEERPWEILDELLEYADEQDQRLTVDLARRYRGARPTRYPPPPPPGPFRITSVMGRLQELLDQAIELVDEMEPEDFATEWEQVLEGEVSAAEMKLAVLRSRVTVGEAWERQS